LAFVTGLNRSKINVDAYAASRKGCGSLCRCGRVFEPANKKPRHEVVTGQFLAQLHLFEVFRRDLRQLLRAGRQISIDPRIS